MHRTQCRVRWRTALATTSQYDTENEVATGWAPGKRRAYYVEIFTSHAHRGFPTRSVHGTLFDKRRVSHEIVWCDIFFRTRRVANRPDRSPSHTFLILWRRVRSPIRFDFALALDWIFSLRGPRNVCLISYRCDTAKLGI